MEKLRLFSYKMTHDTGFAPNPFHGFLTLANCKPKIREKKTIGDWIAGFTSKELNGDKVRDERLIYLMKVTSKINYKEYWENPKYAAKKPIMSSEKLENRAGDNIYEPIGINKFKQIKNVNHDQNDVNRDLRGKYVLISDSFYYFGFSAIHIPNEFRPSLSIYSSPDGSQTHDVVKVSKFLNYMEKNFSFGIIDFPHKWPRI